MLEIGGTGDIITSPLWKKKKEERWIWIFPAGLLQREMRERLGQIYSLHNKGLQHHIVSVDVAEERQAALGQCSSNSVNSLASAAVIVQDTTHADSLLFRSDTASLRGGRWYFLSPVQLLSVMMRVSALTASCPCRSTHSHRSLLHRWLRSITCNIWQWYLL